MTIDLNTLNRLGTINIDEDFSLDANYYKKTDIKCLKKLHAIGRAEIDYDNILTINLNITGIMILPCSITLEEVPVEFTSIIEENLENFDEILKKEKNKLDISEILWENIVLEVPIRVVAPNVKPKNTSGNGWELISE